MYSCLCKAVFKPRFETLLKSSGYNQEKGQYPTTEGRQIKNKGRLGILNLEKFVIKRRKNEIN